MRSAIKLSLALLVFGIVFSSCQKRITKVDSEFVGEWEADSHEEGTVHRLQIDENGKGEYEVHVFGNRTEYAAGVVRLDEEIISIGRIRLKLQRYPAEVETEGTGKSATVWSMRAENMYYYRD